MANSDTADLMSVGRHCAVPDCQQIDFLPFKCGSCGKVYCLEHRMCPCRSASQDTVLVCPLCARSVIVPPGQDPDVAFDRHTRGECDPSNYDRVHRKPRCTAPGCRERLTSTNSYTCRDCGVTVCLRHRLPADHKCPGKAAAAAAAAQNRLGLSSFRRLFSGSGAGSSGSATAGDNTARQQAGTAARQQVGAAARQQPSRPAATGRAAAAAPPSAGSIQAQLQQYRQHQQQQRGGQAADVIDLTSPAAQPASGSGPERCQQCGARFSTVQQLIEHAEAAHAGGWSSGNIGRQQAAGSGSGSGFERCPHCGQAFSDPVELVAHVERQHGSGSGSSMKDTCVLS
ncbi:hypothetical protein COHA_002091 [Chlorella ohadii]|uniref:Uncharacterized protein n=1 Tax=Chlorella ohadii TaxID=2649997 RepID=A0AAD5H7T2_9CHLO|nr:hypothetical protein COHA_002091 [Chlorella ohadii]